MFKKTLSLILTVITLLSVMSITAFTASAEESKAMSATADEASVDEASTDEAKLVISDEPKLDSANISGLVIGYIGDVNEDDKINVKDATYLQKSLAKMIYLTESAKLLADADNNGKLNVRDATTIQKYIAGFEVNSKIWHLVYETGNHSHNYAVTVVEPQCERSGFTMYECICGDKYTDKESFVSATGHNYKSKVIAPTCTEDGYTLFECKNCRHKYKDSIVNKRGHSYSSKTVAPTCVDNGYTSYQCRNCEHSYKDKETEATNQHTYNSKNVCTVCKYKTSAKGVAFDTVSYYLMNNVKYSDEYAGYRTRISGTMGDFDDAYLLYTPANNMMFIMYVVNEPDYTDVITLGFEREGTTCGYYVYSQYLYEITGTFDMTEFNSDTDTIECTAMNIYADIDESDVAGSTIDYIYMTLKNYVKCNKAMKFGATIQDLGFTAFD